MSEFRVRNDTGASLDEVRLTPAGAEQPVLLGPLPPGEATDWQAAPDVHRYPPVEVAGTRGDLVHLPYAGTRQAGLPEGRYTYVLRVESGRLVVDLVSED